MGVKIIDNSVKINRNASIKANVFLRQTANNIKKISLPKTPKKTGELRRSILIQILGLKGKIRWVKNYARFLEDKQFKNYTTPGTGPNFAENAVKKAIKDTPVTARRSGLTKL